MIRLTQQMIFQIRNTLSRKVLHTPLTQLEKLGLPPLFTFLTRDVDAFVLGFQFVPTLIGNIIIIVICLAYIALLSLPFFLAITGLLLLGMILLHLVEKAPREKLIKARERIDALYLHSHSQIDSARELKLNQWRRSLNSNELIGKSPVSEIIIILPMLRQSSVAQSRIEQLGNDLSTVDAGLFGPSDTAKLSLSAVQFAYPYSLFGVGPIDFTILTGETVF